MKCIHNLPILFFTVGITVLLSTEIAADPPPSKKSSCAYIYHASRLSEEYLDRTIPGYDAICISGFTLDEAGRVRIDSSRMIASVIKIAARHRVTLYPMISFQSAAQGRRVLANGHLIDVSARNIAAMARDYGFAGVHLDFEYLPPEDTPKLAAFLSSLRKSFKGKITMAVFPPVGFPEKWSRFHDLKLIGPLLDVIVIMCYDLHSAHTGPGPVTDVKWAERNIQFALRHLDAGKIRLGMPAYGYSWCGNKASVISAKEGMRLAGQSFVRDPSGTAYFTRINSGRRCKTYISDRQTRLLLQELSLKYGLAGTAVWRLGLED